MAELINPTRRGFLGLAMNALGAPIIVKASSLMQIKTINAVVRDVTLINPIEIRPDILVSLNLSRSDMLWAADFDWPVNTVSASGVCLA